MLHNTFRYAAFQDFLTTEQAMVAAVYHDCLCWILGGEHTHLMDFLEEINQAMLQARLVPPEEEPAYVN